MRNVAFSIMLSALAVLQIAVVFAALSPSSVKTAATVRSEAAALQVVASAETGHKTSAL